MGDERRLEIPDVTEQKLYPIPEKPKRSREEWQEKPIDFLLREWDGSSTWNAHAGNAATWELKGVTVLPPEVFQSHLGRLSALPLQYEFRTMDPRVRPTRNEYEFFTYSRFGIIPEILRQQRRICGKALGNPWAEVFHMNNCSRAGGMAKRHNGLLHRVEEFFTKRVLPHHLTKDDNCREALCDQGISLRKAYRARSDHLLKNNSKQLINKRTRITITHLWTRKRRDKITETMVEAGIYAILQLTEL